MNLFTEKDQENARRELDCYGYNHKLAIDSVALSNFRDAAIYLENAARSLHVLADYKADKAAVDQAVKLLQRINREEMIRRNYF